MRKETIKRYKDISVFYNEHGVALTAKEFNISINRVYEIIRKLKWYEDRINNADYNNLYVFLKSHDKSFNVIRRAFNINTVDECFDIIRNDYETLINTRNFGYNSLIHVLQCFKESNKYILDYDLIMNISKCVKNKKEREYIISEFINKDTLINIKAMKLKRDLEEILNIDTVQKTKISSIEFIGDDFIKINYIY